MALSAKQKLEPLKVRLEERTGKLVIEREIPGEHISPGVIIFNNRAFAKVNGQPAFPWQPILYRETVAIEIREAA